MGAFRTKFQKWLPHLRPANCGATFSFGTKIPPRYALGVLWNIYFCVGCKLRRWFSCAPITRSILCVFELSANCGATFSRLTSNVKSPKAYRAYRAYKAYMSLRALRALTPLIPPFFPFFPFFLSFLSFLSFLFFLAPLIPNFPNIFHSQFSILIFLT